MQVYAWFLGTYKLSVFVGMTGYFLLVLDMFGVGLLLARYVEPGAWVWWAAQGARAWVCAGCCCAGDGWLTRYVK